jgi:hypothetical protein
MLPAWTFLKMLAELRQECPQIEEAIIAIERLASGSGNAAGGPSVDESSVTAKAAGPAGTKNNPSRQPRASANRECRHPCRREPLYLGKRTQIQWPPSLKQST